MKLSINFIIFILLHVFYNSKTAAKSLNDVGILDPKSKIFNQVNNPFSKFNQFVKNNINCFESRSVNDFQTKDSK